MSERSVNRVTLIGRLGRDAETSFTPSGAAATKFSLATTRRWKDRQSDEWKEEINWTNCVLWQQEKLAAYLTKGKQVYVEGRLQTRSYEKDGKKVYVTEVVAEDVILLGGQESAASGTARPAATRAAATGGSSRGSGGSTAAVADDFAGMEISDADIPF